MIVWDIALVMNALLMAVTNMIVLFFHVVFVLLTFGAFQWKVRGFVIRSMIWVPVATVGVVSAVLDHDTQTVELIEIPLLSTILTGVFFVARSRERAHAQVVEKDEAFLEAVLENIADGVVACDAAGTLVLSNRATREFAESAEVPVPSDPWPTTARVCRARDMLPIGPDATPWRRALNGEVIVNEELVVTLPDGSERRVVATGRRMMSAAHEVLGAVVVLRDVTERRRAEERQRRNLESLLTLHQASRALNATLELSAILPRLMDAVLQVRGTVAVAVHLSEEFGVPNRWQAVGPDALWQVQRVSWAAALARNRALATGSRQRARFNPALTDPAWSVGLYLPLTVHDRVIGLLEIYGEESIEDEETSEVLGSLASQTASSIENARLYAELAQRETRMHELVGHLLVAQDEERRRVAYNVHDGLAQIATATHQHVQAYISAHHARAPDNAEALDHIATLAQNTVLEARHVIADLRLTALDDFGLASALRLQVDTLRAEHWEVTYHETLGEERLPVTVETVLFRVFQESVTNVRKHAATTQLTVTLSRQTSAVRLEIRDHGCGFDPAALSAQRGPGERIGISGMRERLALIDGVLQVSSRPREGTTIVATVPLSVGEETSDYRAIPAGVARG